ncbi:hypothetical protein JOQ06_008166, partial [Pogonophryne albipinna]
DTHQHSCPSGCGLVFVSPASSASRMPLDLRLLQDQVAMLPDVPARKPEESTRVEPGCLLYAL